MRRDGGGGISRKDLIHYDLQFQGPSLSLKVVTGNRSFQTHLTQRDPVFVLQALGLYFRLFGGEIQLQSSLVQANLENRILNGPFRVCFLNTHISLQTVAIISLLVCPTPFLPDCINPPGESLCESAKLLIWIWSQCESQQH